MCEVVGGPNYEIGLAGESSAVGYKLDTTELIFGFMEMDQSDSRLVTLTNTGSSSATLHFLRSLSAGKVPIDYHINMGKVVHQVIDVAPMSGRVEAGQKQKLKVTFRS